MHLRCMPRALLAKKKKKNPFIFFSFFLFSFFFLSFCVHFVSVFATLFLRFMCTNPRREVGYCPVTGTVSVLLQYIAKKKRAIESVLLEGPVNTAALLCDLMSEQVFTSSPLPD